MQRWKLIGDAAQLRDTDGVVSGVDDFTFSDGLTSFAHPKLKFNFTASLTFKVPLVGGDTIVGGDIMEEINLPLKSATRPSPTINYVDVNFYNYRTKVATRTDYGTATLVFYDDADNKAHAIYQSYLNAISPISTNTDDPVWDWNMAPFGKVSSMGALPDVAPTGLIKTLSVYHYYILKGIPQRTTYKYLNPRIQAFELDDLNMSESDVNTITLSFNYDGVLIKHEVTADTTPE